MRAVVWRGDPDRDGTVYQLGTLVELAAGLSVGVTRSAAPLLRPGP